MAGRNEERRGRFNEAQIVQPIGPRPSASHNHALPHESLDPAQMDSQDLYRLLVSAVVPRPIALVSTVDADGHPNLAPFSFFQLGGVAPASLVVSITAGSEGWEKDTLANLRATGEFVVNLVTREMVEGMNLTSKRLTKGDDEWQLTSFSHVSSHVVRPDGVAESPMRFECRVHAIVEHGTEKGSARYVIGEILRIHTHVREDGTAFLPVGRMGGAWYIDTAVPELFHLERPSDEERRP